MHIGPWEVDFYWPQFKLALETDGRRYHITVGDMERDREKDAWLQRRGIRILRVTRCQFDNRRSSLLENLDAFVRGATDGGDR